MKKIFIPVLALTVSACSFFDDNSSNYWLNHLRNYQTYPIYYYENGDFDSSEKMTESQEIALHTFQRNVVVSANVGQRMVDSETFKVSKFAKSRIIAQQDGYISNTGNEIHITKGQAFVPFGAVNIDKQYYILIRGDNLGTVLLLDEAGYLQHIFANIYDGKLLLSKSYASINPEGLRIAPTSISRMEVEAPKQNFEIIYNGVRDNMIEFTYTDFDENDNKQSQKYVVPYGQSLIDINGVKMQITGVYPDRIEYMLLD